jgi:hypothetical protein
MGFLQPLHGLPDIKWAQCEIIIHLVLLISSINTFSPLRWNCLLAKKMLLMDQLALLLRSSWSSSTRIRRQHQPEYHARMIDVQLPSKQGKQFAKPRTPQAAHVVTLSPMAMEVAHQGIMFLTLCTSTLSWEMSRLPILQPLLFSGTVSL